MKLAFIINVFREDNFHSGGERLFFELVQNAINLGHVVDLYCSKYLCSSKEPVLKINKLTVLGNAKDYKYPVKIEKLYEEFKILTQNENYDRIIVENITSPMDIAVLQGHSAKHYQNMSSNIFEKVLYGVKKSQQLKFQQKWLTQGYNKIFVPSEILKNELMQNFNIDENKFVVVYPGVEIPAVINEIDYLELINKHRPLKIGLSAPSFTKKGGYIFLDALKILKKQDYNFKARIIYPKAPKNMGLQFYLKVTGLDNYVDFLPHQHNMAEFYNSVDCVVMPSLMETFGMVATEAMAQKRIAFVGSYSGACEVINGGENGFVFDMSKDAAKNLAEKLAFLIENPNKICGLAENAFATAKKLSWVETCRRLMAGL